MATFIKITQTYNPLTTQGEGEKLINIDNIVHITKWPNSTNKRIKTIKSRIQFVTGEILEVKDSIEEIYELIVKSKLISK